jgi:hypothetical protein
MRGSVLAAAVLLSLPARAAAQADCFPPDDSNEAQLFAAFAVPLAFSVSEAPVTALPGGIRIALEATYLPNIDEEIRTPTICRPGKGPENTDLLFAFPRPRVSMGLPEGFQIQASWVPPIRLSGVRANLVGLSLQRSMAIGGQGILITVRTHVAFGLIRAPITCNEKALTDETSVCYQGTRSDDRYHPNTFGAEGIASWSIGNGQIRPFLGAGINVLHPRFQVNFTDQFGETDNRKVEVNLTRAALFGGATWAPVPGWGFSGQVYSTPGDAVTGRLTVSHGL